MKTYRFIYNNNDSKHQFECDADAKKESRVELEMLHKYFPETQWVNVFEQKNNGKLRYIVSYRI